MSSDETLEQQIDAALGAAAAGDPEARQRAMQELTSLGAQHPAATVERLGQMFASPPDRPWRAAAGEALAKIGTPEALAILNAALGGSSFQQQHAAALAFCHTTGADLRQLIAATEHPNPPVRMAAVVALGILARRGDLRGEAALRRATGDADPKAREIATEALQELETIKARLTPSA